MLKKYHFKIWGIRCGSCALSIQNCLAVHKDVTNIVVDPTTGSATVTVSGNTSPQALINTIEQAGFEGQLTTDEFRDDTSSTPTPYQKFSIYNLLLAIFLMGLSYFSLIPSMLTWAGTFTGLGLASLTLVSMATTGQVFYKKAFEAFKQRRLTMDSLIAMGTGVAWLSSLAAVLLPSLGIVSLHFLAIPMILGIINTGHYYREREHSKANKMIASLATLYRELQPQLAYVVPFEQIDALKLDLTSKAAREIKQVDLAQVQVGDVVLVGKNKRLPVDGVIISEEGTQVEQSFLTGESTPSLKSVGDKVYAGTMNLGAPILVRVSSQGKKTHVYEILKQVEAARDKKKEGSLTTTVDWYASWAIPVIFALAFSSFIVWGAIAGINAALFHAIAILLCACPCSLVLASPITEYLSTRTLFEEGILIHQASSLEDLSKVNVIVFDKTGTLTIPHLHKIDNLHTTPWTPEQLLQFAASLEVHSTHPIAIALGEANNLPVLDCELKSQSSQGLQGSLEGHSVIVGSPGYMEICGIPFDSHLEDALSPATYIAIDGVIAGRIELRHAIRPEAKEAIKALQDFQFKVVMLTGDHPSTAKMIAQQLGIQEFKAQQSSEDKGAYIQYLQEQGNIVAVIGDGLNDYHALDRSHVSIAVESWTQAASNAKISLRGNLHDVGKTILASRQAMRNVRQNLVWSLCYNAFTLAAASGILMFMGISLSPVAASVFMALSSLLVVFNALRVKGNILDAFERYQNTVMPLSKSKRAHEEPPREPRGICGDITTKQHKEFNSKPINLDEPSNTSTLKLR